MSKEIDDPCEVMERALAIVLLSVLLAAIALTVMTGCKSRPIPASARTITSLIVRWDESLPNCCAIKATKDPERAFQYSWQDCALVMAFPKSGKVPAQNLFRCEDGSLAMQDAETTLWAWRP